MKSKIALIATLTAQGIYAILVGLNFLCIWLFHRSVPYTYPFAIVGNVILIILPIELICLGVNFVCQTRDLKLRPRPPKMAARILIALGASVCISVLKVLLWQYGDSLAGMV